MQAKLLVSRRAFLKSSLITAGASLSPVSWAQVAGANDTIRVAVVGVHGRGGGHIGEYKIISGVRVAALCDVDLKVLESKSKGLEGVEKYQDIRKLLENKNIDAIFSCLDNPFSGCCWLRVVVTALQRKIGLVVA